MSIQKALCDVAQQLQDEWRNGERSSQVDLDDLCEVLVRIADADEVQNAAQTTDSTF